MKTTPNSFYIWIMFLILLINISTANSLKCYKCSDCKNKEHSLTECENDNNYVCFKFHVGDRIDKDCIRKEACNLEGVERFFGKFWNNIKNFFGAETDSNSGAQKDTVSCCTTNYCNAANIPSIPFSLIGMVSFAVLLFNARA